MIELLQLCVQGSTAIRHLAIHIVNVNRSLTYTVVARHMNRRSRTEIAIDEEDSVVESISNSEASEDDGPLTSTSEITENDHTTTIVPRRHTRSSRMLESPGGLIDSFLIVRR